MNVFFGLYSECSVSKSAVPVHTKITTNSVAVVASHIPKYHEIYKSTDARVKKELGSQNSTKYFIALL